MENFSMKSSYRSRTGGERTKYAHKSNNSLANARRTRALARLKIQLESGKKVGNDDDTGFLTLIPLLKKDRERIESEILILQSIIL